MKVERSKRKRSIMENNFSKWTALGRKVRQRPARLAPLALPLRLPPSASGALRLWPLPPPPLPLLLLPLGRPPPRSWHPRVDATGGGIGGGLSGRGGGRDKGGRLRAGDGRLGDGQRGEAIRGADARGGTVKYLC